MFRSLFDRKKPQDTVPEVADLTIGRTVAVDPIETKLWPRDALLAPPETGFTIVAQGQCDLGEQSFLHRFYLDDDRYLIQIQGGDGVSDRRVDEIVLWYFYDVAYLARDTDWRSAQARIRSARFDLPTDGAPLRFDRVWFSHAEADEEPMTYWEEVREDRAAGTPRRIFQSAMLYGRGLSDGSDEMLLANLEEPETGDRAMSFMIGRALPRHALIT